MKQYDMASIDLTVGDVHSQIELKTSPEVVERAVVDGFGVLPFPGVELSKLMVRLLSPFVKTYLAIQAVAKGLHIPAELYKRICVQENGTIICE